jgi:hypothetical protein
MNNFTLTVIIFVERYYAKRRAVNCGYKDRANVCNTSHTQYKCFIVLIRLTLILLNDLCGFVLAYPIVTN